MFSGSILSPSKDRGNLSIIYQRIRGFLKRCDSEMEPSAYPREEPFVTPASSNGDLMAMSPVKTEEMQSQSVVGDLLGDEFEASQDHVKHDLSMDIHSIDYLVKLQESRHPVYVDRGKESLFVKFDPLYSQHNQNVTTVVPAPSANDCDFGYETGSTVSTTPDHQNESPKHGMSTESLFFSNKERPTQIVRPAVKPAICGPTMQQMPPPLVRSVSAILTPNRVATDRLINIAGNSPTLNATYSNDHHGNINHLHSMRTVMQKQDRELLLLRNENRDLKSYFRDLERKLIEQREEFQTKLNKLTVEKDNLMEKEVNLTRQLNEKIVSNKQLNIVMEEYEKTISVLIGENQRDKVQFKEREHLLESEKDDALKHLASMELSFNDLLSKYEKSKLAVIEFREREKLLTDKIAECEMAVLKYEELYNNLKKVTTESLTKANETLESMRKNHLVDIAKLNATIKKQELTISSLQENLVQKTRDHEELTRICDQLINAVN